LHPLEARAVRVSGNKVNSVPETGSLMLIEVKEPPFAPPGLGVVTSLYVGPSPSRATLPVRVCVIILPSASTCFDSKLKDPENGAPFSARSPGNSVTGLPLGNMGAVGVGISAVVCPCAPKTALATQTAPTMTNFMAMNRIAGHLKREILDLGSHCVPSTTNIFLVKGKLPVGPTLARRR
jgi:hypothetical protein